MTGLRGISKRPRNDITREFAGSHGMSSTADVAVESVGRRKKVYHLNSKSLSLQNSDPQTLAPQNPSKDICEKAKTAGVTLIDVTAVPRITIACLGRL